LPHSALAEVPRARRLPAFFGASSIVPGLALTGLIAGLAFALRLLPGVGILSPLILAILLGMAFHNGIGTPARCKPGIVFSLKRILRLGIILLGLQLTLAQVIAVGGVGLAIMLATVASTFFFTLWLGRRLGVDPKLAALVATGTSICGASAVIAANVVTEGSDEDVAYSIACVTVFGSLAMVLYPILQNFLRLDPLSYGLWSGTSIHEIAQVVAAAFQDGSVAGNFATVTKLSRIILLAPLVVLLGAVAARNRRDARRSDAAENSGPTPSGVRAVRRGPPLPWFVVGFIAMILLNSVNLIPVEAKPTLVTATNFLLAMALASMGLETDLRKLRAKGWRPMLLGAGSWLFIASFSLGLIELAGR
jgi:uncharacterized integral membrane protein (TIGR00698 family)